MTKTLGEHLFFQSAGRTWDLLTWNDSKNNKLVQRQCPWQWLKADVSEAGGRTEACQTHSTDGNKGWICAPAQMLQLLLPYGTA